SCVGKQTVVHQALDNRALEFQAGLAQVQQLIQVLEQGGFIASMQVAQSCAVDCDHAQRARLLGGAEQPIATLEQLTQIELQSAAHGPDHIGLELGIDEVLKVGQPIARGHFEQQFGIGTVPVEILGDVIGGNRKGE